MTNEGAGGSSGPTPGQPPYGGQAGYGQQYPGQQYPGQYAGQQYGRPPYAGAYGYPTYPAPQTDGTAIAALVCAIGSFVVFPIVPAIAALFLARSADASIRASHGAR